MSKTVAENITTNNFLVNKHVDFKKLRSEFRLIKYTLSKQQDSYRRHSDNFFYARFTNSYKETFDSPFYYHTYSGLYALLPINSHVKKWLFEFDELEEISSEEIAFDELELHILVKLLTALFFYNDSEKTKRVCQNRFFIVGKNRESKVTAVRIEVKEVHDSGEIAEFHIASPATKFLKRPVSKIKKEYLQKNAYYELVIKEDVSYLRQIKPSKVVGFTGNIYSDNIPFKTERAHLDWYSDRNYTESKSFLVHSFKRRFLEFLQYYGLQAFSKSSLFTRLDKIENTLLPIENLKNVVVFDNRLNKSVPIRRYVDLMQDAVGDSLKLELTENVRNGYQVLLIQDCEKQDFKSDDPTGDETPGVLRSGFEDPYKAFYLKYPNVPKQSINVNTNSGSDYKIAEHYLNYTYFDDESERVFKIKIEVCLNELYLKSIILNESEVATSGGLPFISDYPELLEWGFVQHKHLLHFVNGRLKFDDLSSKTGKEVLSQRFIRWSEIVNAFKMRRPFLKDEDIEDKIHRSAFIVRKNDIIEIERLEEAVLPEIDKIKEVKGEDPKTSARGRELITSYSGGIWHNEADYTYVVGSPHSMNSKESRAQHVYKIHKYQENSTFDLKLIVKLLCVKFVRNRQFTVYPYFFDLLRLYRELAGKAEQYEEA
jgi:hypothetical protein